MRSFSKNIVRVLSAAGASARPATECGAKTAGGAGKISCDKPGRFGARTLNGVKGEGATLDAVAGL
jgi:hypothetical protein